jgi:hypothetical protein
VAPTDGQTRKIANDREPEVGALPNDDLAREHPEHHRMITWAQLEGVTLDEPQVCAPFARAGCESRE